MGSSALEAERLTTRPDQLTVIYSDQSFVLGQTEKGHMSRSAVVGDRRDEI